MVCSCAVCHTQKLELDCEVLKGMWVRLGQQTFVWLWYCDMLAGGLWDIQQSVLTALATQLRSTIHHCTLVLTAAVSM